MDLKNLFSNRKHLVVTSVFVVVFAVLAYAGGVATGLSNPSLLGQGVKAATGGESASQTYSNDTPVKAYQQYQSKGKSTGDGTTTKKGKSGQGKAKKSSGKSSKKSPASSKPATTPANPDCSPGETDCQQ